MGITVDGLNTIRSLCGSPQPTQPTHIAVGSGAVAFADTDTALGGELDRNAITDYDMSTSKVITYTSNFSSTELSGLTINEFGIFNAVSAGSLFQREVIGSIAFEGDRELQIQAAFRFSGA